MRDEQVRRYARHILLPDVGGVGQTALLAATGSLDLRAGDPAGTMIAATYLAAGGVGALSIRGADATQIALLAAHGPDTAVSIAPDGLSTSRLPPGLSSGPLAVLAATPAWWPAGADAPAALAFWRGGLVAARWMADIANR